MLFFASSSSIRSLRNKSNPTTSSFAYTILINALEFFENITLVRISNHNDVGSLAAELMMMQLAKEVTPTRVLSFAINDFLLNIRSK